MALSRRSWLWRQKMNKGVLKNLGLLTPELEEAKSGDLMIVIKGASEAAERSDAGGD